MNGENFDDLFNEMVGSTDSGASATHRPDAASAHTGAPRPAADTTTIANTPLRADAGSAEIGAKIVAVEQRLRDTQSGLNNIDVEIKKSNKPSDYEVKEVIQKQKKGLERELVELNKKLAERLAEEAATAPLAGSPEEEPAAVEPPEAAAPADVDASAPSPEEAALDQKADALQEKLNLVLQKLDGVEKTGVETDKKITAATSELTLLNALLAKVQARRAEVEGTTTPPAPPKPAAPPAPEAVPPPTSSAPPTSETPPPTPAAILPLEVLMLPEPLRPFAMHDNEALETNRVTGVLADALGISPLDMEQINFTTSGTGGMIQGFVFHGQAFAIDQQGDVLTLSIPSSERRGYPLTPGDFKRLHDDILNDNRYKSLASATLKGLNLPASITPLNYSAYSRKDLAGYITAEVVVQFKGGTSLTMDLINKKILSSTTKGAETKYDPPVDLTANAIEAILSKI